MAQGVKHYFKSGVEHKGATHKASGKVMSGKTHTSASQNLVHFKDLSKTAQKKAMNGKG